jgi:catechol 2,3-dioxygenase-like lactoylglutathione lyase family enzyme
MFTKVVLFTIVVRDYDEAIDFYTNKLGFILLEDTAMDAGKRWVRVSPAGDNECGILLAKAKNEEEISRIGNQTGGRVGFFLHTNDFWGDYHRLAQQGVTFVRPPSQEAYGTVTVFRDLYGNLWDLIEPANAV